MPIKRTTLIDGTDIRKVTDMYSYNVKTNNKPMITKEQSEASCKPAIKECIGDTIKLDDDSVIETFNQLCNAALNPKEEGRMKTSTNYMPYGNGVGVDIIIKAKVIDILSSKDYGELLGKVGGDVFETGEMNPSIRVNSFGHQVQGLTIGDYIDIANVPGAVTIKGTIAGGYNFHKIKALYNKRNPTSTLAIASAKTNSQVRNLNTMSKGNRDKDELTTTVEFMFKGKIESHYIEGIYFNRLHLKSMDTMEPVDGGDSDIDKD